jgi:hypothetical protein
MYYLCINKNGKTKNIMKKQLLEDLQTAKNTLAYTNEALTTNLENWERKEFELVKNQLTEEIASLEIRVLLF